MDKSKVFIVILILMFLILTYITLLQMPLNANVRESGRLTGL